MMDRPATLLDRVLDTLRRREDQARSAGVTFVGVVGSVARGDAAPDSDVDVVFEARDDLDYWRLGALQMDLQDDVGRRVDLVDRGMMRPDRWRFMSVDLVRL